MQAAGFGATSRGRAEWALGAMFESAAPGSGSGAARGGLLSPHWESSAASSRSSSRAHSSRCGADLASHRDRGVKAEDSFQPAASLSRATAGRCSACSCLSSSSTDWRGCVLGSLFLADIASSPRALASSSLITNALLAPFFGIVTAVMYFAELALGAGAPCRPKVLLARLSRWKAADARCWRSTWMWRRQPVRIRGLARSVARASFASGSTVSLTASQTRPAARLRRLSEHYDRAGDGLGSDRAKRRPADHDPRPPRRTSPSSPSAQTRGSAPPTGSSARSANTRAPGRRRGSTPIA